MTQLKLPSGELKMNTGMVSSPPKICQRIHIKIKRSYFIKENKTSLFRKQESVTHFTSSWIVGKKNQSAIKPE